MTWFHVQSINCPTESTPLHYLINCADGLDQADALQALASLSSTPRDYPDVHVDDLLCQLYACLPHLQLKSK